MASPSPMSPSIQDVSAGGRIVATDGRVLPLTAVRLAADTRGGVLRAVLVQVFRNVHPEPLQVTYQFPLPHGGAVSGFAFRLGQRRIVGEVDRLQSARERFEQAIAEGKSAALLEQVRGSAFTQEVGNVPAGAEIEAEITVDQRLDWRQEGGWEWRFPTALAPRYQGEPGRVPDAARGAVELAEGPLPPRLVASLTIRDELAPGRRPESPSHAIAFRQEGGLLRGSVGGEGGVPLDRDLVVRWPAATAAVGFALDAARPGGGRIGGDRAFGLLTVVPPDPARALPTVPRDLIVLLDTSGSMSGEPLDQARRVVGALVDSLGPQDRLELIAFSHASRRWREGAVEASEQARADAHRWLAGLSAGGGTEMRGGIREALRGLRAEAQRQVVLVTDGLIGFEGEVVAEILAALPESSRVHTVGVGSAVNRSLTGPAARAGRGLEVIVGLGEDPERAAAALRARTAAPLVTRLEVEGSALVASAPARLPDLFAGAPALVSLELRPQGGSLIVRGVTAGGPFERRLEVPPPARGGSTALAVLFGREAVEDLEMRLAAGEEQAPIDRSVEELGLAFQIATRLTSWVAVTEEATVDPAAPIRRERMPGTLPHGMAVEGLGLRKPHATAPAGMSSSLRVATGAMEPGPASPARREAPRRMAEVLRPRGPTPPRAPGVPAAPPAPAGADQEDEGLPSAPARRTRPLAAVVRLVREGELVLEVTVPGGPPFAWDAPARVRVRLEDGSEREVEVDRQKTTRAGYLTPGQAFRLVLRMPAAAGERVTWLEVDVAGAPLGLRVRH